MAALAWLATQLGPFNIASANMSLGGGTYSDQAACDAANVAQKNAIDILRGCGCGNRHRRGQRVRVDRYLGSGLHLIGGGRRRHE